jgi:hypothetical protein
MDMDEEVATANAIGAFATDVGDGTRQPEEAPEVHFAEGSAEADEDQEITSGIPRGLLSESVHSARRGGLRGESGPRLAHDKFFNAFEDDFDESDMKLDVTTNQPAS